MEKLVILAGLRKLETAVKEELKEMAISVNVMENAYLRELFLGGKQEGKATTLLSQLEHRFGEVPSEYRKTISNADLPTLENWSLRVLDAQSLEEVIEAS